MKNIQIRKVDISDAPALLDFFKKVGSETDFLMMDENGLGTTVQEEEMHLKQYDNPKRGLYLVAVNENGYIVGQSAISQEHPTCKKADHIYGLGIVILKDYWGQGIATQMMNQLINYAKEIGIGRLDLYVVTTNEKAIGLYKKFGFKVEGTLKKCNKVGDEYQDEHIMALIF
jgi:RimJ/RimL family protein N-acetyltransferase